MSNYRSAAPPTTSTIKLETADAKRVFRALMVVMAVSIVPASIALAVCQSLLPRNIVLPVNMGILVLMAVVFLVGLRHVLTKMNELRFVLEIGEAQLRLLVPNGEPIADTSTGTLRFTRVNYTRRGRHGSAYLRPGWRLQHPRGDHLIGTLLPELSWDGVVHDPRVPEFELRRPAFEELDVALRRVSSPRHPLPS